MRRRHKLVSTQANLFGKTLEQIQTEKNLRTDIENLELELERIDHLRNCERCMVEAVLGIERYMGSRLPWYLNLVNDVSNIDSSFNDLSETGNGDCPKPQDYEIGWYGNDFRPGTTKFIKARLEWAEKAIKEELVERQQELKFSSNLRGW